MSQQDPGLQGDRGLRVPGYHMPQGNIGSACSWGTRPHVETSAVTSSWAGAAASQCRGDQHELSANAALQDSHLHPRLRCREGLPPAALSSLGVLDQDSDTGHSCRLPSLYLLPVRLPLLGSRPEQASPGEAPTGNGGLAPHPAPPPSLRQWRPGSSPSTTAQPGCSAPSGLRKILHVYRRDMLWENWCDGRCFLAMSSYCLCVHTALPHTALCVSQHALGTQAHHDPALPYA